MSVKINNYYKKEQKRNSKVKKRYNKTYKGKYTKRELQRRIDKIKVTILATIIFVSGSYIATAQNSIMIVSNDEAVLTGVIATSTVEPTTVEEIVVTIPLPVEVRIKPTREEVKQEIIKQAKYHNVNIETALRIGLCESQYVYNVDNWEGSGARGVYQFKDKTWEWIKAEGHQYDYKENIKQFMTYYPIYPHWWACT